MASRTTTDRGANNASYFISREGSDAFASVVIQINGPGGEVDQETADFAKAEILTIYTAGERSTLVTLLAKLYDAALVKRGFV